jgi:tetratricopeptide (TPR) repeat protein
MSWPPELEALVEAVVEAVVAEHPPDPHQLASIARWRLGCGDGRSAARWHRWSLEPPPLTVLARELHTLLLLLNRPQLTAKLGQQQGWGAVALALEAGNPEQALSAQQAAIADGAPIEVPLCLRLASLWQQQQRPEPALELLEAIAAQAATPALCNAIAHLLEQQQHHSQAAPWWDRSLSLDPQQPPALMQRSRNALAQGDAALSSHLAMALLELDPHHTVGQELLVESLGALGALASQRLALVPLVRARRQRYLQQAKALEAWWRPRRRRQARWRQQLASFMPWPLALLPLSVPVGLSPSELAGCSCIGLLGSRDGLELIGALTEAGTSGVVWHLASREPLVCQRNLQRLLPEGWQLRRWSRWQPELHGGLDALVIADRRRRFPPEAPALVLRPGAAP